MLTRSSLLLMAGLTLAFVPGPAAAQSTAPGPRVAILAGALMGDDLHPFIGGEGGVTFWRMGILATGHFGSGNEFDSLLLGAGPALRLLERGRSDLYLTAGVGSYRETLESGPKRSTTVFTGGLSGRLPAGPVRIAVSLLGWSGNFGGVETTGAGVQVSGLRFAVGVGL